MTILGLLNAITPKDAQSRRLAKGVAYGKTPRQALDVYGPRNPAGGPLPVVVFFYGGSWDSGERGEYEFAGRALAALGYIVVIPDHRLVPEVEYPIFLDDLMLAVDWVVRSIAEYGGDPMLLALVGHSAGAYNATMLALDDRYLAARGLLARVKGVAGLSGPYDFFPFDVDISRRVFGAVADGLATQPVNLVTPRAPPMLLASGLEDRLVGPHNTKALAARLRVAGVPVIEHYYAGTGHPLPVLALGRLLRWRLPVLTEVSTFLSQCFSGEVQTSRAEVAAGE
jgi:acetyl esterase/lipase